MGAVASGAVAGFDVGPSPFAARSGRESSPKATYRVVRKVTIKAAPTISSRFRTLLLS
jgi:hypothetical protein